MLNQKNAMCNFEKRDVEFVSLSNGFFLSTLFYKLLLDSMKHWVERLIICIMHDAQLNAAQHKHRFALTTYFMSQHLEIKRCSNCRAPLDNKRRLIHCTSRRREFKGENKKANAALESFEMKENMTEVVRL